MIALEDGSYTIAVTLSGGSGRAGVDSPAELTVEQGEAQAHLVWSSPYYDYMEVDGQGYSPVNEDGNSEFWIPVSALDTELPVSAETTAMSTPHMIEYTLYFDSETIQSVQDTQAMPWGAVAVGAVVLLCGAALLARRKGAAK